MRFELGGAIENPPVLSGNTAVLEDGGLKIVFSLLGGAFDGQPVKLEVRNTAWDLEQQAANANVHRRFVGEEPRWYVDVVFYHGEYKPFKLNALKDAWAAVALSMEGEQPENAHTDIENGMLTAETVLGGSKLAVVSPALPVMRHAWKGDAVINDVPMKKTYGL